MPRLPGLRPTNMYREPATLRRHPPIVVDPNTYLETDASRAATPTDTALWASFQLVRPSDVEHLQHEGIKSSGTRRIITKTRLYATISDTNQGLPDPDVPRRSDQVIYDGKLWNVIEVNEHGAPHYLYSALLLLAPTEDAT